GLLLRGSREVLQRPQRPCDALPCRLPSKLNPSVVTPPEVPTSRGHLSWICRTNPIQAIGRYGPSKRPFRMTDGLSVRWRQKGLDGEPHVRFDELCDVAKRLNHWPVFRNGSLCKNYDCL